MRTDPRRLPPLDLLVAFDAAARHLSFTKAAAERFVTQSAMSRQIAALEEDLGAALFHRRHRALELTAEGTRLAAASAAALASLREAVQAIRAPRQREVVALTTTPGFASLWLIPRLARFIAEHPGIDVRIDATYDKRALAGEGFDVAVRYARTDRAEGEALFSESVQPLCAPALLTGEPPLRRLQDLKHHTFLHLAMPTGEASPGMPLEWQAWLKTVGAEAFEPAATLTFTSYDTAVAAALEGQGVVLGRRPLTDGLVAQGRLVAPFKGQMSSARGYSLVIDAVAARRPAVQALAGWLRAMANGAAGSGTTAAPSKVADGKAPLPAQARRAPEALRSTPPAPLPDNRARHAPTTHDQEPHPRRGRGRAQRPEGGADAAPRRR